MHGEKTDTMPARNAMKKFVCMCVLYLFLAFFQFYCVCFDQE
jgi:hypothetical protein